MTNIQILFVIYILIIMAPSNLNSYPKVLNNKIVQRALPLRRPYLPGGRFLYATILTFCIYEFSEAH